MTRRRKWVLGCTGAAVVAVILVCGPVCWPLIYDPTGYGWDDPPGAEKRPDPTDPNKYLPDSQELAQLLDGTDREGLEDRRGRAECEWVSRASAPSRIPSLSVGGSDGIYGSVAWVSPGGAGCIWVEARHAERDHRLSVYKTVGRNWMPVSAPEDQELVLRYEAHPMVDEGNWGYTYPARFEVWFRPASGGPDQKLVECEREIHGWTR